MRGLGVVLLLLAACGGGSVGPDGYRSGSRLRAQFLEEPGGAREFLSFHDTQRDEDCYFWATPTSTRCFPSTLTTAAVFADAGCTKPLVEMYQANECNTLSAYVATTDNSTCDYHVDRVWKVGTQQSPGQVYVGAPGSCTAHAPDPNYAYYGTGDEVPLDDFVGGQLAVVGDHRIRDQVIDGDDGSRQPYGMHDSMLDADCYVYGVGNDRCIPNASVASYFSDGGCTQGIVATSTECASTIAPYVMTYQFASCQFDFTLYQLGDPATPSPLYQGEPGACTAVNGIPDAESFWTTGAEIPKDQLATITWTMRDDGDRIAQYDQSGEDGYHLETARFHDRDLDVDCYPQQVADGAYRCLPSNAAYTTAAYADAGCTDAIQIAEQNLGACNPADPTIAVVSVPDGPCTSHNEPHALGATISSGSVYSGGPGACAPFTFDPAVDRYYQVGAAISLDSYVEFTKATE